MSTYSPDSNFVGYNTGDDAELNRELVDPAPTKEGRNGDKVALYVGLISLTTFMIGTWLLVFLNLNTPTRLGAFAVHPILETLAITCWGLGIIQLQPTSQPKTKARGLSRHQMIILFIGLPSIIVGTAAIFVEKSVKEKSSSITWHTFSGYLAIVWMICQMLLGGLSVWFGGRVFGGGMKAKKVWRYHRASGYLLFPWFLMTAASAGGFSAWSSSVSSVGVRVLLFAVAPIFALGAIWSRIRLSKMNFRQ